MVHIHLIVESMLATQRRQNHRVDYLNDMEEVIDSQRQRGSLIEEDVVLWRHKEDKFKPKFSSQATWQLLTQEAQPIKEWYKGIWFTHAHPNTHSLHGSQFITDYRRETEFVVGTLVLLWLVPFVRNQWKHGTISFLKCPYSANIWRSLTQKLLDSRYTAQCMEYKTLWTKISKHITDGETIALNGTHLPKDG